MILGCFISYAETPHFGSVQAFHAVTLDHEPCSSESSSDVTGSTLRMYARTASDGGSLSGRMREAVGSRDGHLVFYFRSSILCTKSYVLSLVTDRRPIP